MIAATSLPGQFKSSWQQALADAISDPAELWVATRGAWAIGD